MPRKKPENTNGEAAPPAVPEKPPDVVVDVALPVSHIAWILQIIDGFGAPGAGFSGADVERIVGLKEIFRRAAAKGRKQQEAAAPPPRALTRGRGKKPAARRKR